MILLGDLIEKALSLTGITPDRVEEWLGRPCNCRERKEKLNQLGLWAARVVAGRLGKAREYLERILDDEQ